MAHYDIFRDQLGVKYPAFGHALWEPNPGRYTPVEVGDVGFIREGKFHRLFNALLPADHPSHERFGVPEHYEPLLPGVADHIDSGTLGPNDFCSFGVHVSSGGLEMFASEYLNHILYISLIIDTPQTSWNSRSLVLVLKEGRRRTISACDGSA